MQLDPQTQGPFSLCSHPDSSQAVIPAQAPGPPDTTPMPMALTCAESETCQGSLI